MPVDEPSWWYDTSRPPSRVLMPLSRLWAWSAVRRYEKTKPYRCSLPVICAGNFTAGGTGKTPLSILIGRELQMMGARPAFLTRGYGGRTHGPHRVEPAIDTHADVGDEPLLLAREAQVMISANRKRGAELLEQDAGLRAASVIVMDDGLQNPALAKDLVFAVVDGQRGLGNGQVMPAGPLRAPLAFQLALAGAIVVNRISGDGPAPAIADQLRQQFPGPVLEAWPEPDGDVAWLKGARVLAFAGIANPQRFIAMLERLGANVVQRRLYRDHHAFTQADAQRLLELARAEDLIPVTTEKDSVRFTGRGGALAELAGQMRTLPIHLVMSERDRSRLISLLEGVIARRG